MSDRGPNRPIMAYVSNGYLWVTLSDRRIIATPVEWYPGLANASEKQLKAIELNDNGVYWPELDGYISTASMLEGYAPLFRFEDLLESEISALGDEDFFPGGISEDDLIDDLNIGGTLASD